jgi:predicted PurR-regulated permease PerM
MGHDLLERHRSLRILIGLLVVMVALYLLGIIWSFVSVLGDIILLFFLAWVVTFILDPVAAFLMRRGFPRVLAVALVYIALLVVISGLIVLAIPALQGQVTQLAEEIRADLAPDQLTVLNHNLVTFLQHIGLSQRDAQNVVTQLSREIPARAEVLATQAVDVATNLVTSILGILFNTSLVIILSFYMLLDGGRLSTELTNKLPPAWIPDVRRFEENVNATFGGFFRAQIIIAAIYAALTYLVLLILGQPNGLLAALLAGIIMMVPFIGSFVAIVPPLLIVLLQTSPDQLFGKLIVLLIFLVVAQQIALNLIAPRVFGHTMGVNPLILFAGFLIGAKVGGVWGAFFAGPIIAVLYATLETAYERFAATSPLFKQASAAEAKDEPGTEMPALDAPPTTTSKGAAERSSEASSQKLPEEVRP